jgi:hypothetical protein
MWDTASIENLELFARRCPNSAKWDTWDTTARKGRFDFQDKQNKKLVRPVARPWEAFNTLQIEAPGVTGACSKDGD